MKYAPDTKSHQQMFIAILAVSIYTICSKVKQWKAHTTAYGYSDCTLGGDWFTGLDEQE